MLRLLFVLLLVANALTYAWTQGHLMFAGWGPVEQREPERLRQQIQPEKLRLLAPASAPAEARPATPPPAVAEAAPSPEPAATSPAAPPAVAPEPTACWFAAGFTPEQATRLRSAFEGQTGLTADRWSLNETTLNARWIVYLGKFASLEALQRSRAELRQARVDFRDVNVPALQPGLALGTYSSQAAAEQALQDATRAGVRGARVVQERPDSRSVTLRLPAITDTERRQVTALGPALAGKNLQRCP